MRKNNLYKITFDGTFIPDMYICGVNAVEVTDCLYDYERKSIISIEKLAVICDSYSQERSGDEPIFLIDEV
jgi:hypothetical protein